MGWSWFFGCMIFLRYNITHALYIEEKKECNIIHSATMITSTAQICYLKYPIVPSTPGQVLWDATVMLLRAQHGNQKVTYHYRLGAPREHTNTQAAHPLSRLEVPYFYSTKSYLSTVSQLNPPPAQLARTVWWGDRLSST